MDDFDRMNPARFSGLGSNFSEAFIDQYPLDSTVPYRSLLFVIFLSNLWTLVLTIVPVMVSIPPNNYYTGHDDWYTGSDVVRLLEPIGGTVFNFVIFYRSGIFKSVDHSSHNRTCVLIFLLGLGIYGQGAGLHTGATMIKSALKTFDDDTITNNGDFEDLLYYVRTTWEHIVSHYLYAVGLVMMHMAQAYAFRECKAPLLGLTKTGKFLMVLCSLALGLLVAATAINFPSGIIVALIYIGLYGFGAVGGYLVHEYSRKGDKTALQFGGRPVVQYFLLSYIWALLIIIAWIIAVGGIKTRSQVEN